MSEITKMITTTTPCQSQPCGKQINAPSTTPRVPMIVVSPYARRGAVDHTYDDHASILKFIEANWKLNPLTSYSEDNLPNATPEQKLATAFHRQTLTNTEGGTDQEQFRNEAVFDRTETTGAVWLGLTVGCALCHTHKYDRISQREYYQLFAFFNNGDETLTKVGASASALAEAERLTYLRYRDQILPQAQEMERMAEDSYRLGQTNIAALLQALQQSRQVRLQSLQTASDLQNALSDLERAIGAPLP